MVSCDKNNYGCSGGYLNKAWDFLEQTGVSLEKCVPYEGTDDKCPIKCADSSEKLTYKC